MLQDYGVLRLDLRAGNLSTSRPYACRLFSAVSVVGNDVRYLAVIITERVRADLSFEDWLPRVGQRDGVAVFSGTEIPLIGERAAIGRICHRRKREVLAKVGLYALRIFYDDRLLRAYPFVHRIGDSRRDDRPYA